jgi:hypothetical protein
MRIPRQFSLRTLMAVVAVSAVVAAGLMHDPDPPKVGYCRYPGHSTQKHGIKPNDLLTIEVLEALPGRPITGDRPVHPDGTIDLGYYGSIYVAGLTADEAREEVVIHLREYLSDDLLGLVVRDEEGAIVRRIAPAATDHVFVGIIVPWAWEKILPAIDIAGTQDPPPNFHLVQPASKGGGASAVTTSAGRGSGR